MVNGSLVCNSDSGYNTSTGDHTLYIGSNRGIAGLFTGYLFKVLIFNRELTPKERIELDAAIQTNLGQPQRASTESKITVFDGNSIPNGVTADNLGDDDDRFTIEVIEALNLPYGSWHNLCRSGSNISLEADPTFNHRIGWIEDYYEKPVVVLANYWYNEDFVSNSDYAEVSRDYMDLAPLNTHFIWGTPPSGNFPQDRDDRRAQDITDILADQGSAVAIWRVDTLPEIGLETSYDTDSSYFGDSVHLSSAGQAVMAASAVIALNAYTPPAYIGTAVVTSGQQFTIPEQTTVGTRLNGVSSGVPAQIQWTGGGTASAYSISDSDYSVDSEGYITVAVLNSTVETITPNVTVTNEAGESAPESVSIAVTDVDETQTPSIPSQNVQLFTDSLNNQAGGVLSVFTVTNLTTSVSISGDDASRFSISESNGTVTVSLVGALPVGTYRAILSGENNDPDGTFTQSVVSTFDVTVDVNTDQNIAFDFDPETSSVPRIKTLEDQVLNKDEYGTPLRFYLGFKISGTPSIIFKKPNGVEVEKTNSDGVIISNRDFTSGYGTLFEAEKCLYYPIEQNLIDTKGQWQLRYKSNTGELGNWHTFQVVD
jgi:hypothetical protein